MDKKPFDNETAFYEGYEETTQTYLSGNEKTEPPKLKYSMSELRKKAYILMLLMAAPMAVCFAIILWNANLYGIFPALYAIIDRAYHILGVLLGLLLSSFILRRISLTDEKREIYKKHIVHFIGFAGLCWTAVEMIDPYEYRNPYVTEATRAYFAFIPLALAFILLVWGFFLYTKTEKKVFIPLMCITLAFAGLTNCLNAFRTMYDMSSYSIEYYFVSCEEIEPKSQEAKYYIAEGLDSEKIMYDSYMSFYVFDDYKIWEHCITKGGFSYYCDDCTAKILADMLKDDTKYNEKFFEENYLIVDMSKYYGSPKKYEIVRIFIDSDMMKIKERYFYKEEHEGDDMTEYCFAFITVPRTYDIKNLEGMGSDFEYNYNQ